MIYHLGSGHGTGHGSSHEWELDEDLWQLRWRGERVAIQPMVLALLFHLARNRERVVAGKELLRELWPDEVVTSSSLARAISLARAALGDRGSSDPLIQTVTRRGYRLRASEARQQTASLADGALIGRDGALGSLRADLRAARDGGGRVRILRGEVGIGKTRLVDEIAAEAQAQGALVCRASCVPESGQPGLWPWLRVARALLDSDPVVEPGMRARLDHLQGLVYASGAGSSPGRTRAKARAVTRAELDASAPAADLRAGAGVFETVDGLAGVLGRVAVSRPILIALDDIQWADRDSLRVLELLARELASSRVRVCTCWRRCATTSWRRATRCALAWARSNACRTRTCSGSTCSRAPKPTRWCARPGVQTRPTVSATTSGKLAPGIRSSRPSSFATCARRALGAARAPRRSRTRPRVCARCSTRRSPAPRRPPGSCWPRGR